MCSIPAASFSNFSLFTSLDLKQKYNLWRMLYPTLEVEWQKKCSWYSKQLLTTHELAQLQWFWSLLTVSWYFHWQNSITVFQRYTDIKYWEEERNLQENFVVYEAIFATFSFIQLVMEFLPFANMGDLQKQGRHISQVSTTCKAMGTI